MSSVHLKLSILWGIGLCIVMGQMLCAADPPTGDEAKTPPSSTPNVKVPDTSAPRADKPRADSGVQAKSPTTVAVTDPKELKRIVAERIDTMAVSDLKAKMARAQAVLSLEGQAILKDRATLRREADRLAAALKDFAQDSQIQDIEALLANEGFRNELSQALQIGDEKGRAAAILESLKKNRVDVGSLKKVVVARKVKADASLCDKCIANAEKQLDALQRVSADKVSADVPYSSSITDLAKIYGDNAPAAAGAVTAVSADDLTAVLKALLTAPGEDSKPSQ